MFCRGWQLLSLPLPPQQLRRVTRLSFASARDVSNQTPKRWSSLAVQRSAGSLPCARNRFPSGLDMENRISLHVEQPRLVSTSPERATSKHRGHLPKFTREICQLDETISRILGWSFPFQIVTSPMVTVAFGIGSEAQLVAF